MKKEILDEINRLLGNLEQDPHLPDDDKEVDEGVKAALEWLKAFVERLEDGKNWIDVNKSLPPMDDEVIVLRSEFPSETAYDPIYKISFGHIVDRRYCVDYGGWNVPYVKYWMPCPEIPGQDGQD